MANLHLAGHELNQQIGKLRKQKGYTQEQLADKLGVTYQAVSKWENGQTCPDISLLPVLSELLDVTLDELFGRRMKSSELSIGLMAEYLFNGNAEDSSGSGLHASVFGATLCKDRFGRPDSAYAFDGKDDYLIVQPAPFVNKEAFSLSVWCRYDEQAKLSGWSNAIVSQDGHHDRRVFQLSTRDDNVTFHRFLIEPEIYSDAPLTRGDWYHFAVTYENEMFKLYRNGKLVSEQAGKLRPHAEEPLYIGRKSTEEPYFFFHGCIDDLRMYDRALTAAEVRELYLENNWTPVEDKPSEAKPESESAQILEGLELVQLELCPDELRPAVDWYTRVLGFHLHMDAGNCIMLSLYNGPNLMLRAEQSGEYGNRTAPFIYWTKRSLEEIRARVEEEGATRTSIWDEGFAYFLGFEDPFGYFWMIKREKR